MPFNLAPQWARRGHHWVPASPAIYRRLLTARRNSAALQLGSWTPLPGPEGVLVYERELDGDRRVIVVNFTEHTQAVDVPGEWTVEVASDGTGEGDRYSGAVASDQGVVLT